MWPFRKEYVKTIHHEDWLGDPDNPYVIISKKEHKCGKIPWVEIKRSSKKCEITRHERENDNVKIYRNLPIYRGTPYTINVYISRWR